MRRLLSVFRNTNQTPVGKSLDSECGGGGCGGGVRERDRELYRDLTDNRSIDQYHPVSLRLR